MIFHYETESLNELYRLKKLHNIPTNSEGGTFTAIVALCEEVQQLREENKKLQQDIERYLGINEFSGEPEPSI